MNKIYAERVLDNSIPEPNTGCYIWLGSLAGGKEKNGRYGVIKLSNPRRQEYTHRVVYDYFCSKIQNGEVIHHKCENKLCVNPEHLEATDQRWHILQHHNNNSGNFCKNGHDRSIHGRLDTSVNKIRCRECQRLTTQRHRLRKKR